MIKGFNVGVVMDNQLRSINSSAQGGKTVGEIMAKATWVIWHKAAGRF